MMNKPSRFFALSIFTIAVLLSPSVVRANHPEVKSCSVGHWYFKNSETPMVEVGGTQDFNITQGTAWTTILQSCDDELGATSPTMAYNATYRHWLILKSMTVPVGTPYEVEVATVKAGVATVHQVISRKIQHSSSEKQPHTDYLAAYLHGLTGNSGIL